MIELPLCFILFKSKEVKIDKYKYIENKFFKHWMNSITEIDVLQNGIINNSEEAADSFPVYLNINKIRKHKQ